MKKVVILLTLLGVFSLFPVVTYAESDADKYIYEFENIIPDGAYEGAGDPEVLQDALDVREVFEEIVGIILKERGRILALFFAVLGSTLILALASSFSGGISESVAASAGTVVSVLIFSSIWGIYSSVSDAISEANGFFAALIPIAVGLTSLGGGTFAAGVQATGMSVTASVVSGIWNAAFTSVSGLGLAMSLVSAYGGNGVATVSRWVKKAFSWVLGIVTALISGTLALQTMVATARDSAVMRAAKYAASGMIPVVGSTVSGALSTLASGVSYVKGIVGGGAVLVIISLLLSPLILILLYRLVLSFAVFASQFFGVSVAEKMFGSYLYSLDTVITVYTLSAVVYVFQIILFVKSGVALL